MFVIEWFICGKIKTYFVSFTTLLKLTGKAQASRIFKIRLLVAVILHIVWWGNLF